MTDSVRDADEDNPEGYYEVERAKQLDKGGETSWLGDCGGKAVKIVSALLQKLPAQYPYRVVFLLRDIDEVLASQKKMLLNRGKDAEAASDERMKRIYRKHLREVRYFLQRSSHFDVLYVNFRDAMANPLENANKVAGFLGGNLDADAMAGAVNPDLYRNRL